MRRGDRKDEQGNEQVGGRERLASPHQQRHEAGGEKPHEGHLGDAAMLERFEQFAFRHAAPCLVWSEPFFDEALAFEKTEHLKVEGRVVSLPKGLHANGKMLRLFYIRPAQATVWA